MHHNPASYRHQPHKSYAHKASCWAKRCLWVLGLAYCSNTGWAAAEGVTGSQFGLSASVGTGARNQDHDDWRIAGQYHWARTWWQGRHWHFTGYWDLSLANFDASDVRVLNPGDSGAKNIWALSITPVLRWQFQPLGNSGIAPFMELAVGVSYLSDSKLRTGKLRSLPLGSHFQFEDRGVVGLRFGRHWEVAYQRMHYSNLNLASENHGLDAHLIMLNRRF